MSRPMLVGQAPGPNTDPLQPLYPATASSAGGRLARFMGLTAEQYLDIFDRVNLLHDYPGKNSVGEDKFPLYEARIAAGAIRPLLRERTVVLVGRGVALAWGGSVARADFMSWSVCPHFGTRLVCVPHPSGRNHWYNSQINQTRALSFWQTTLATLGRTGEAGLKLENAA